MQRCCSSRENKPKYKFSQSNLYIDVLCSKYNRALNFENLWQLAREQQRFTHEEEELRQRERAVAAREAKLSDLPLAANSHNRAAGAHRLQVLSIFAPGTESETKMCGRSELNRTGSVTDSYGSGAVGSERTRARDDLLSVSESLHTSVKA